MRFPIDLAQYLFPDGGCIDGSIWELANSICTCSNGIASCTQKNGLLPGRYSKIKQSAIM